jgi:hypothetical protein
MEQHPRRIDRFVGMKFVKQAMAGMIWLHQPLQFKTQRFDLRAIEHRHAGEIAVFVIKGNLIAGKPKPFPIFGKARLCK